MSTSTRTQFAEVVRQHPVDLGLACLLIESEANHELDVVEPLAHLEELAARIPVDGSDAERLHRVLGVFAAEEDSSQRLDGCLLSAVLRRRRGSPTLLAVIWLEVARRAGIAAYGTSLPGQLVVGIGDPDEAHVLIDPCRSSRNLREPAPLVVWDAVHALQRVLGGVRRWAELRPERIRTRLWSTELGLLLPGHPVELRHELGHCLARLGRDVDAAAALERYAAEIAQERPEVEERARVQARMLRARLN